MLALPLFLQDPVRFEITGAHVLMLFVSTGVVGACVLFHYEAMSLTSRFLPRTRIPRRARIVGLISTLMMAHVLEVWAFALMYWGLGRWPELGGFEGTLEEGALDLVYFSATAFTTLGFGDIVPRSTEGQRLTVEQSSGCADR